jgi:TRAP-type mannitol/chloroaromatic compound transport system permease small subunit
VTLPTAPVTLATTWLVLIVVPVSATAVVASVIFDQSTPAYPAVADADVTTVTVAGMHPVLLATKTTAT